VINIVFMNYLIGHNLQVISQLSRGGLSIVIDGEIARAWMRAIAPLVLLSQPDNAD
jgi:hypothetical protein